jgi:hypothetical protein
MGTENTRVFLIDSSDRDAAVRSLFENSGLTDLSDRSVVLKANLNSAGE